MLLLALAASASTAAVAWEGPTHFPSHPLRPVVRLRAPGAQRAYYVKYSTFVRNSQEPYGSRVNKMPVSPGCHTTLLGGPASPGSRIA